MIRGILAFQVTDHPKRLHHFKTWIC